MQILHNLEAEEIVIGCILKDYHYLDEIDLKPEEFYSSKLELIYKTMLEMYSKLEPITFITLSNKLPEFTTDIARLAGSVPTSVYIKTYAEIVRVKAQLRQIQKTGERIQQLPQTDHESTDELISQAEKMVYDLSVNRASGDIVHIGQALTEYSDMVDAANKNGSKITGVDTGYYKINYKTSGLQVQDLIILGARPSMGKTAFALNIAENTAIRQKLPTAIFSLEMSRKKLAMRMIASESRIDTQKLKLLNLTPDETRRYTKSYEGIEKSPLFIDDTPGISAMEILSKSRRIKKKHGLRLVIIDYLGLMAGHKGVSRYESVSENTRILKNVARELDCPVLCLAQLSRGVEQRDNKRPMLSDLRETGEIEQTSDMVWFLYRDEYYNKNSPDKGISELIIAKQRDGPTGTINLKWFEQFTKFENLDHEMGKVIEGGWPGE